MSTRTARSTLVLLLAVLLVPAHAVHASAAPLQTVEAAVRAYFEDTPVMIEIARCESKFRQFNADGTPLYGGWGGGMVGVFQFYDRVHRAAASALNYDLRTLEGNLGYAKHVYETSKTSPWNSSRECWNVPLPQHNTSANAKIKTNEAALREQVATLSKLVVQLQLLLEQKQALAQN